jgi:hypothetical protein
MTVSAGLREIAAWPRSRFCIGLAVAVVFITALAALSGLMPFGTTAGAGWRYPLLLLLGGLLALYGATAAQAPIGAEMTLCDLRWPALATIATVYAGRDSALTTGLAVLFDVAAVTLMVWAVVHRLEQERQALSSGDGEVCLTCRPLFNARSRRGTPASGPESRPLSPAPVRLDRSIQEFGDQS